MASLGISAHELAQAIHVPVSRVKDILHDRQKVTADISLRLARCFDVSDRYFLDIQHDIDIWDMKDSMTRDPEYPPHPARIRKSQ